MSGVSVFIPSVLIQGHLLLLNDPVPTDVFLLGMFGWQSPERVEHPEAHMAVASAVTHV